MAEKLKIAVLISGRGSNLQALIDSCGNAEFPVEIVCVISNEPGAAGLDRAAAAGIATDVVPHRDFESRETFEDELDARIRTAGAELIALAGFMRLLTGGFVEAWRDRLVIIHPSLLPAFKGLHTHERVLELGARFTGCTVHFVRPEMDAGPIIAQAAVPVLADDDADSLAARVLEQEHILYPLALRLIAEGKVRVDGELAIVSGALHPEGATINPAP